MPTAICCDAIVIEDHPMNDDADAEPASRAQPTPSPASDLDRDPLAGQPFLEVQRDGVHYSLLGTAHISQASIDAVEAMIEQHRFDAVAVELCASRFAALANPDGLKSLDLFAVIREGKTGLVAANLALSAYQRRLAEQLGISPGAEMRAAIDSAKSKDVPVWCIDREIGTTFRRTSAALGFFGRLWLTSGLIGSLFNDEAIEAEEIERLKEGDILESTFAEFATKRAKLYGALIAERDAYMAAQLRRRADSGGAEHVFAVIGAGHLAGIAEHLKNDQSPPRAQIAELDELPKPGWIGKLFAASLIGFILVGFAFAFTRGAETGGAVLLDWVMFTAIGGAVGCIAAGGHPLSVLGAALSSPITPLHPALASGTVSAMIELWVRKPTVADFEKLREDAATPRGWWRNRVSRTLLNFLLTSFGTAIAVYFAAGNMIRTLV